MGSNSVGLEAWFISSLANAGSCHKHSSKPLRPTTFFTSHRPCVSIRRLQASRFIFRRRNYTNGTELEDDIPNEENTTKEELMQLVDQYSGNSYTDQLPLIVPPRFQPSDGPHLTVSDEEEDEWPPPDDEWPADDATQLVLQKLKFALKDIYQDSEVIYEIYRELPEPRAPYLPSKTRHQLLHHLSIVEKKDEHSMLRYFSVIDDMKASAIPLLVSEWTSAISFASRYVNRSGETEVQAALQMWKEMEHIAGVKGNHATFNILYDVACKAGKFPLAEMVYKEMIARGFEFNRFHHVSVIYACGLQGDGDGARAAYAALVNAGEIVDTVVLNAMISALISSHEPNAAINIYERMKSMHLSRSGAKLLPQNFKDARIVRRTLINMGRISKERPEERERLQQSSIIAPDLTTYKLLVNHFAVGSGELDKATQLLDEMSQFEIPLSGSLFISLFKGFAAHGGIRYTEWTAGKLNNVFKAYMKAIDQGVEGLYIGTWIVTTILKAFTKCSGKAKAIEAWETIKEKWNPGERELVIIMPQLRYILDSHDDIPGL